jgi:hypothetical protein
VLECLCIPTIQQTHVQCQNGKWCFNEKMVFVQQAVGEKNSSLAVWHMADRAQKVRAVWITGKNELASIVFICDMGNGPGDFKR